MGARNVAAVYGLWSLRLREQHRAFRVLIYMALVSKDDDDPPRFFAGRDALALALGRAPTTKVERHAAYEAVRAAVDELVRCGAIERAALGRRDGKPVYSRPGHQAEYHLCISVGSQGEPVATSQGEPVALVQGEPAEWPRVSLRTLQGDPVPKEEQEDQELEQEEISRTYATSGEDRPAAEVIAALRDGFSKKAAS